MPVSSLPLDNFAVNLALNTDNQPYALIDIAGGYNKIAYLINMMNPQGSTSFDSETGFFTAYWDQGVIIGTVQNTVLVSPTELIINFTDPTYDAFRVEDVVQSGVTMEVQGRVIAAQPGQIRIMPWGNIISTGFNPAIMFTANSFVVQISNANPTHYSGPLTTRNQMPTVDFNYSQVWRNTWGYTSREANRVKFMVGEGGIITFEQQRMLVQKLLTDWEIGIMTGYRNRVNQQNREYDQTGGWEWAIKNRGGEYIGMTTPLTLAQWTDFIGRLWDKSTDHSQPLLVMGGRPGLDVIRQFYTGQLGTPTVWNTFEGTDLSGLNLMKYPVNGMEFVFMEIPYFNDRQRFPTTSNIPGLTGTAQQNKIYVINPNSVTDAVTGAKRPAVEKFHWGKSPWQFGTVRGMVDGANAANVEWNWAGNGGVDLATAVDSCSFHIKGDNGADLQAARFCGLIEPIV